MTNQHETTEAPALPGMARSLLVTGGVLALLAVGTGAVIMFVGMILVCSFGSSGTCGPNGLLWIVAVVFAAALIALIVLALRGGRLALDVSALVGLLLVAVSFVVLGLAPSVALFSLLPMVAGACLMWGGALGDRRLVPAARVCSVGSFLGFAVLLIAVGPPPAPIAPEGVPVQAVTITVDGVSIDPVVVDAGSLSITLDWQQYDTGRSIHLVGPLEPAELARLARGDDQWRAEFSGLDKYWGGAPRSYDGYLETVELSPGRYAWYQVETIVLATGEEPPWTGRSLAGFALFDVR